MKLPADPKIKVSAAIAAFDGNQAALARYLDINRAAVTRWISSGRELVPGLHAYRLRDNHPDFK